MALLERMQTFVEIAEAGGISRAAERMDVAVSAVSRGLKELEAELGVSLVRRTTRRMSLTEAGERYLKRCRAILDDVEDAREEVAQTSRSLAGTLRLALPVSFAIGHMAPLLAGFVLRHPELRLDITVSDLRTDLVAEGIDVAIRIGALSDTSLRARRLCRVHQVVCASPAFLATRRPIRSVDDLEGLPAICYANLPDPGRWHWRREDGTEGVVRVEPRMRIGNGDLITQLAIAGLGVICEPSFIVHDAISRGQLVPLCQDRRWAGIDVNAVYAPTRHLSRRARLFIDYMAEKLDGVPDFEAHVDPAPADR